MSKIAITRKIVVTGKNTNAENVVKHDNPVISLACNYRENTTAIFRHEDLYYQKMTRTPVRTAQSPD